MNNSDLQEKCTNNKAETKSLKGKLCAIGVLLFIVFLEVFYFRSVLFSDALIGDFIDARLNNVIVEHWFRVVTGQDEFLNLRHFYPTKGVIFQTDLLMGFAPLYCLVRFFGANMFLANKITVIAFHVFGTLSMYYLLRYQLKVNTILSLIGLTISSFACNYAIRLSLAHTQMLMLGLIPIIAICALKYFEYIDFTNTQAKDHLENNSSDTNVPSANEQSEIKETKETKDSKIRLVWGMAAVFLVIVNLYSGYYTLFFNFLFCIITLIVFLGVFPFVFASYRPLLQYAKKYWKDALLFASSTILLALPMVIGALPSLIKHRRMWREVWVRLMRPCDFINVSEENLFYGSIIKSLHWRDIICWGELEAGFTVLVFVLFIIASWVIFTKGFKNYWFRSNVSEKDLETDQAKKKWGYCLLITICLSVLVSFLLLLRIGDYSLWYLVYKLVPGGGAIRNAARYALFLNIPMAAITVLVLQYFLHEKLYIFSLTENMYNKTSKTYSSGNNVISYSVLILLFCVLFAENQLTYGILSRWDIASQKAFIDNVPPPPKTCRTFFVADPTNMQKPWGQWEIEVDSQLNAILIAQKYNLETINGYGTPHDWYLRDPGSCPYKNEVISWVQRNNLNTQRLFAYSIKNNTWQDYTSWCKGRKVAAYDSKDIKYTPQCVLWKNQPDSPSAIIVYKDNMVFGPGVSLEKGSYIFTAAGRNMDCCGYTPYYIDQQGQTQGLEMQTIKKESTECIFRLDIAEKTDNVGLIIRNKKNASVLFFSLSWEKE